MTAALGELLTAMVTPFDGDGRVNLGSARRLAQHLVDTGSDGVVVCGTTGEGPTVSDREALDLLEAIVSEIGGGATVVANTGSYDTHHSVALTRSALATGVDAIMAVTPYYSKPPRAGLIAHFRAIAEAADGRPVIIYNIPQRVIVNLEPDVLAELAQIPNVVAVKQATPDIDQARRIVAETDLVLYAGTTTSCCRSAPSARAAASPWLASRRPAVSPADRPGPRRRSGRCTCDRPLIAAAVRYARGDDEPHPAQVRAEPARPRCRRAPIAPGRRKRPTRPRSITRALELSGLLPAATT